jgi:hypothetical protein
MFFIPLVLFLAAAWAVIGVLLAKWLKQAGYTRPFKGRQWRDSELYGDGVGFGRVKGVRGGVGERKGMPEFGRGRVKGWGLEGGK